MPGYIIHLTEAKLIMDLFEQRRQPRSVLWQQSFLYGSLLPDAVPKMSKHYSHFWRDDAEIYAIRTPQWRLFLEKYGMDMREPKMLGYLAHLYLDQRFFDEYFSGLIEFRDAGGCPAGMLKDIRYGVIKKTGEQVPLSRLFSGEYMYGDYTRLNLYLYRRYLSDLPDLLGDDPEPDSRRIEECSSSDMKGLLAHLKDYLKESAALESGEKVRGERVYLEDQLKVFDKSSLEKFLMDVAGDFFGIFIHNVENRNF